MDKATKITIINSLVLLVVMLLVLSGKLTFPLVFSYLGHKLLHILGIMMFFGNMVVGPIWLLLAIQTKNSETIAYAIRVLKATDIYITVIGVDLAFYNGLSMAGTLGDITEIPWLFHSVILLFVMWLLMIPVIYLQELMYKHASAGAFESSAFKNSLVLWGIFGTILTIPPSLIFYLMVFKGW